jgi:hypothetical protein
MPLSSSSVDRRIPEALSTSRKRNLIVEGQHLRDAGAGIAISVIGTNRTNWIGLTMSVDRGRPEVTGGASNRRF